MNADWLMRRERRYGGVYHAENGMRGGDRMQEHGYAAVYGPMFDELLERAPKGAGLVIVELGILRGSGLAVLCDAFPSARVIGLDIDPARYRSAQHDLKLHGAFMPNHPEVHEYDELDRDASRRLGEILAGDQIDVFIDDAQHYDAAIIKALEDALPWMRGDFRYCIEDNNTARDSIVNESLMVNGAGFLTVVSPWPHPWRE